MDDEKPTSVIFDHCTNVYEEMEKQAREEDIIGPNGADTILVYEGHLTKLVTGHLQLATPYYTQVMNHLKAMGCVDQLRRGGGNSPSRWALRRKPDEGTFKSVESMNRRSTGKVAVLEQQVRDLNKRVLSAESTLKNVEALLQVVHQRVVALTSGGPA